MAEAITWKCCSPIVSFQEQDLRVLRPGWMWQPWPWVRSNKQPLHICCRIIESRLPIVRKLSSVYEDFGIAEPIGSSPREKSITNGIADEQNQQSDNQPALHIPNEMEISYSRVSWRTST